MSVIYKDNDNDIVYDGLRKANPHQWINDATLEFTLKDSDFVNVSGAVGISMDYVAGSNGKYVGVLPGTVSLTADATYYIYIDDTGSYADQFDIVKHKVICKERKT